MGDGAFQTSISATVPWAGAKKSHYRDRSKSPCHYRGWTLVDSMGYRWAVKDGSNMRVRICRDSWADVAKTLKAFRAAVDEMEDA